MKYKKIILFSLLPLLISCSNNEETVTKKAYDTMYEHLTYCWCQSLEGTHYDNAFYGDSRVIGGQFVDEFNDKSVINLGVGGDKVDNLIHRFSLIKTVTPKRVFLAIGGNDALSSEYNADTFKAQYRTLLNAFKAENIDVVVHNVVGITTSNSTIDNKTVVDGNKKISEINSFIKSFADEFKYSFLDIASIMNKQGTNEMKEEYSLDGVHFNTEGYKVWYSSIKDLVI